MKMTMFLRYLIVALIAAGCTLPGEVTSPPQSPSVEAAPTATSLPPSATPEPEFVHLQVAPGEQLFSIPPLARELERLAQESGFLFSQGSLDEAIPERAVVLVTTADPELIRTLQTERPELIIVALGGDGLEPGEGMTLIGPDGLHFERAAFMAGYLGAMLVPDHRIGMISPQDQPALDAWRSAFVAGHEYYCGLCRTVYPPFEDYPLFATLPTNFESGQAIDQLGTLKQRGVTAVFVAPTLNLSKLTPALSGTGLVVFSAVEPGSSIDGLTAVIRPAPELDIVELWPSILAGEAPQAVDIQLIIDRKEANAFSDARLELAQQVLDDLNSGFIMTQPEAE